MTHPKPLFLLLLAFLLGPLTTHAATDCNAVTEIAKVECESLLELYHSTDGANWHKNDGWNVTNTPCSWIGVTCENGDVTGIGFGSDEESGNNLNGTIPNFSGLPNLQVLALDYNELTGTIPDFSGLPNLIVLDLEGNQLTGSIPNFSELPNLVALSLDSNQLTGTIPDFSGLPNLTELSLSGNQLTGNIPDFSELPNLTELSLWDNQLTGSIPDFSGLPNLVMITLSNNQLMSTIPNFSGLPNLEQLWLISNQLTGTIPNFSGLPNLEWLSLSGNQLTGSIPDFNGLPNLERIDLNNNQLTGTIPDFSGLPNLTGLFLSYNQLTGSIPNFSELSNLTSLSLSGNQLTGTIPDFSGLPNLYSLDLSYNQLTGTIPDFSGLPNLYWWLSLSGNQLTGSIPDFSGLPNLQSLSLYGNKLTGSIPDFSGLPHLERLSLSGNQLTGSIPDFNGLPNLERIDLNNNQLTGTIPNFSGLPNLERLSLSGNQLTGSIPDFNGLPNLERIDLNNNQLTGTIPDFSGLPNLTGLFLGGNQLIGTIPDFSGLPNLGGLDLGNNQLTGAIPEFSGLQNLRGLNLRFNQLTGNLPDFSGLPNLTGLSLMGNQLTGTLPDFSGLLNLTKLYLSDNQLIGTLPDFSGLFNLKELYLNNNQLTGSIPGNLPNLREFDISGNQLDFNPGQAIIIAGPLTDDTLFKYSNEFAQRMYRLLVKRGYNDENIHYMNILPPVDSSDGRPETERQDYALFNPEQELTEAFAQATANLKAGEQFILYFHGHARPDLAYLADYELTATQLRDLLATVPTGIQQIIILDTCYAGSFLDDLAGVADRIVIASTNANTETFQVIGNSFANEFLSLLEYGESLMGAFRGAEDVILNNPKLFAGQRPWLDDDGDGQFLNDGLRARDVYIETRRLQQSPPPAIKQVHPYITLSDNIGSATLWVQTTPSAEFIHQVRAVLVKPNYQPIEYRGKDTDFSRLELPLVYNQAQERYEVVYDGFCAEPGTWQIQYQAQDTDGAWSEIVTGEVQAQNCSPATAQMSLNQSRYTTGEPVRLDMTVNGNAQVDLYVAIVFPDGTFITIAHPLIFSWPNAVQVYQPAVPITGKHTYSIMDMALPAGIALGNYSACGILLPAGHDNPIDATQWIHSHCIGFEVY